MSVADFAGRRDRWSITRLLPWHKHEWIAMMEIKNPEIWAECRCGKTSPLWPDQIEDVVRTIQRVYEGN